MQKKIILTGSKRENEYVRGAEFYVSTTDFEANKMSTSSIFSIVNGSGAYTSKIGHDAIQVEIVQFCDKINGFSPERTDKFVNIKEYHYHSGEVLQNAAHKKDKK
jgi:IMP cyclohydrolase